MPDNAKSPPEPSMEEIIASIGRIITDDKRPGEPTPPVSGEKSAILELTEVVNEDGSVRRMPPSAGNPTPPSAPPSAGLDPLPASATARGGPGPSAPEAGTESRIARGRDRILSSATSGAAAAAFAQLGSLPRERLPLGSSDRTLEDIVRDLLRPMLQAWLDQHLPSIVERLVREEIARVIGDAGLR
jgi:hypothetical protein